MIDSLIDLERFAQVHVAAFQAAEEHAIFSCAHLKILAAEAFQVSERCFGVIRTHRHALGVAQRRLPTTERTFLNLALAVPLRYVHAGSFSVQV